MATFRVKARVLDLLGEQQIANCPTAISELFKNSHDAYATQAKLDVYVEDDRALLWDDGIGMTETDLLTRWLVVGTSGKSLDDRGAPPPPGFAARPIQGEKGIGRLAISTLGDSLLLISKKRTLEANHDPYAALFINWNIVHNLNLMLSDIDIPVVSFRDLRELDASIVRDMVDSFQRSVLDLPADRWNDPQLLALRETILRQLDTFDYSPLFAERTDIATAPGGTLLYIKNLKTELVSFARPPSMRNDEDYAPDVEAVQLLSNFRNHFSNAGPPSEPSDTYPFDVDIRRWDPKATCFVSVFEDWQAFDLDDLKIYDQKIDVRFDEYGRYAGTIEVYGTSIELPTPSQQPRRPMACGPFELKLWYFQGDKESSRLDAERFSLIQKKLQNFGGLMIYRDALRVLPYGRADYDWLFFEERRSRNAGRYFFGYRRMFGYVAISSGDNPRLRDKSGREGLITNAEYRQFRQRLIDFFSDIAAKYFHQNKDFDEAKLEIQARNGLIGLQQRRAQERRDTLKEALAQGLQYIQTAPPLLASLAEDSLASLAELTDPGERELTAALVSFRDKLNRIEAAGAVSIPRTLSLGRDRNVKRLIHDYQQARDHFERSCRETAERFGTALTVLFPDAERAAARHKVLTDALFQGRTRIGKAAAALQSERDTEMSILNRGLEDFIEQQLERLNVAILAETNETTLSDALLSSHGDLPVILSSIGQATEAAAAAITEMSVDLRSHIQGFFGERRDAVLAAQTDAIEELRETVDRNLDLVQLGLSVEVIDHELNKLYRGIRVDVSRLATMVRNYEPGVRLAERLRANFQHLEQRYKLMSPLYRGTYRIKSDITGAQIVDYVRDFLSDVLETVGVKLEASPEALSFHIREVPSVVLPVFVNLVDNAIYWLRDAPDKRIRLGLHDGVMTICDSGPGIHETLLEDIFQPFFTTKPNGRGLGLYVARANLERYNHEIWASTDPIYRTLGGACICIKFNKDVVVVES